MIDNLKIPIVLVVALGAQLAAGVFYGANILRDINDNTERSDELLEILLETEASLEEIDEELWSEFDAVPRLMTDLIRLQARVSVIENTLKFTKKDAM